ncbi:hypothetical protein [Nocardia carnea]|uniref:hypothetical protein n=1 Tax=Nocardia carnea TaxID=37328 RepID=UPI002457DA06|nr:hypothetical protein [Nocardia carnea]
MYPIAPANSARSRQRTVSQCPSMPALPVDAEQSRQAKPAGDRVIDRLLPQHR